MPPDIVRGSGTRLYDSDGIEFLETGDTVPPVGVPPAGHAHPHVVDAVARRAARGVSTISHLDRDVLDYSEDLLGRDVAPWVRIVDASWDTVPCSRPTTHLLQPSSPEPNSASPLSRPALTFGTADMDLLLTELDGALRATRAI